MAWLLIKNGLALQSEYHINFFAYQKVQFQGHFYESDTFAPLHFLSTGKLCACSSLQCPMALLSHLKCIIGLLFTYPPSPQFYLKIWSIHSPVSDGITKSLENLEYLAFSISPIIRRNTEHSAVLDVYAKVTLLF